MRVLLVASSLVITFAATSQSPFAQTSNPEESAARATMQSQTPGGTWAVIEAQVKNTLEQAGFKNIQVMPSSFVVQADPQPIILMRKERTPIRPSARAGSRSDRGQSPLTLPAMCIRRTA